MTTASSFTFEARPKATGSWDISSRLDRFRVNIYAPSLEEARAEAVKIIGDGYTLRLVDLVIHKDWETPEPGERPDGFTPNMG